MEKYNFYLEEKNEKVVECSDSLEAYDYLLKSINEEDAPEFDHFDVCLKRMGEYCYIGKDEKEMICKVEKSCCCDCCCK